MQDTERDRAHELIERIPRSQIGTAVRFLEFILADPVHRSLTTAPADNEPVTDEDRRRFLGGQAWFSKRGGKGIPMEEVLAEFGVKTEDFLPEDDR